jgi:hypothetical protein
MVIFSSHRRVYFCWLLYSRFDAFELWVCRFTKVVVIAVFFAVIWVVWVVHWVFAIQQELLNVRLVFFDIFISLIFRKSILFLFFLGVGVLGLVCVLFFLLGSVGISKVIFGLLNMLICSFVERLLRLSAPLLNRIKLVTEFLLVVLDLAV